ncbi:hypothetical protein MTP99_002566 [Tenebrio molitor]|nr:hypothetical protein MTP99_002566 [Tenebrio molitor]
MQLRSLESTQSDFQKDTILGHSSPTATAASQRPRAAIEAIKGPRRACRGQFHSEHLPTPIPSPTIHLTPSTSSEPAPNTPPTPLPTPDFRPVRSPSERTRSSPVSGPFAPLASPNSPPQPRHTPTGSLATPPRGSSRADRRKYEHPLIFLAAEDIPQVTGTIPGGSRLHQVVPLVHSVNKGFATTVCLFPPLPRALTADPWTPSLRRATPAVWRPTTAEKRDWRSRHTATDRRQIASRDVTTGSDRHNIFSCQF